MNFIKIIKTVKNLTDFGRKPEIAKTREVSTIKIREVTKPIMDSLKCPYCLSTAFTRRGFRQKKREKIQLYQCKTCQKTFTPQMVKGKHYPLTVMLEVISIYNLGYSLEKTCQMINEKQQKTRLSADSLANNYTDVVIPDLSNYTLFSQQLYQLGSSKPNSFVNLAACGSLL